MQLGVAELSKQCAFRFLASGVLLPETEQAPSLNFSIGVQGIGTGNPGYSTTFVKNFEIGEATLNAYVGVGFRSNENHAHAIGGLRLSMTNGFSFGLQEDGHQHSPFITYSKDRYLTGFYLVGFKTPAYLIGMRF